MNMQSERSLEKLQTYVPGKVTWPYIAGFLDCDGWITWGKPKQGRIRVTCGLTQSVTRLDGMKTIQTYLKNQGISAPLVFRNKSWKSDIKMVNIQISARTSIITFLENILPYIILKRDLAYEALAIARQLEKDRLRRNPRMAEVEITESRSNLPWSEEEVDLLRKYTADGYNVAAIAAKLQRSCNAVSNQRYRQRFINNNE